MDCDLYLETCFWIRNQNTQKHPKGTICQACWYHMFHWVGNCLRLDSTCVSCYSFNSFNLFKNASLNMITGLCWDELSGMDSVNYSEQSQWTNQCKWSVTYANQATLGGRSIMINVCPATQWPHSHSIMLNQSMARESIDGWMGGLDCLYYREVVYQLIHHSTNHRIEWKREF